MPEFTARLAAGMQRAREHLWLSLVPVLFALLDSNKLLAVATFDGGHIGFQLGLPLSVVTVWQFVSVPNSGVAVNPGLPIEMLPVALLTAPVLLVAQAAAMAGYFGSLRDLLDGETSHFVGNVRAYFAPFLVVAAVPFLAVLPLAVGVFGVGALTDGLGGAVLLVVIPALLVFLAAAYLLYATPYLIVLRDTGVLDAARGSYALAVAGGPYASYAAGFALFVLVVSPFATAFVVNVPLVGLLIGIPVGGVLGLGANFATMRFVADIDPRSGVDRSWDSGANESSTSSPGAPE